MDSNVSTGTAHMGDEGGMGTTLRTSGSKTGESKKAGLKKESK